MTENEKIKKLSTFCNNLGKGFRSLVESAEKSEEKFKNEISALKKTNAHLEKEVEIHRTELLSLKELANSMQQEIILLKEIYQETINEGKNNGEIVKNTRHIECQVTKEKYKHDEEIKIITDEIAAVTSKLVNIEGDLEQLKKEEGFIRKKVRSQLIQCDHCHLNLDSLRALEMHMKEEHVSSSFKCDKCRSDFYSEWRLKKLLKSHENEKTRHCHYFNSNKTCPFEELGCKFLHKHSTVCKYGDNCRSHMCQFKH